MKNRFLILGLASFLAVALAVPALGGPSNPVADGAASAKKTAKKALKQARKAKTLAKGAQNSADAAQSTANGAQNSADDANAAAGNAQTTADAAATAAADAQTDADAAQASADAAQATADSKFGTINNVEGTASASNNSDKSIIFATCSGDQAATGGGFIVSGAGADDSHISFNTGYIDSWGVGAEDGGSNASNWSITPTVRCAAP